VYTRTAKVSWESFPAILGTPPPPLTHTKSYSKSRNQKIPIYHIRVAFSVVKNGITVRHLIRRIRQHSPQRRKGWWRNRRSVSALSSGAYTTTLLVMVDRLKGGRRAPSPGWAEFTIMMECTTESAWSLPVYLYSLVCDALHYLGWTHAPVAAFPLPLTGYTEQYEGRVVHYHCLALQ
jgi:hypothetical protein